MYVANCSGKFFEELKDWSERKLQLLEKYLSAASKIMGSVKQVYYIDGFAGSGIYEDGSKGSPVRAAELAQKYQVDGKSYSLKCINVEQDSKRFANLQTATIPFGDLVLNFQGTFVENVDRILREVRNQPVICFLDPFGIKGIDWAAIERIIHRGPWSMTDLWIRFDTQIMLRLRGFFDSKTTGAEKKFGNLPQVFGITDKAVLYTSLDGRTTEERLQNALHLYENQLVTSFRNLRGKGFAASYPIKSLNEECKYYLVFATAHPKGATLASEVVYGIEETYQHKLQEYKSRQPQQLSLFFTEPTEEDIFHEKIAALKDDIWQSCKGKTLIRLNIYMNIWKKWFGKITSKHMTVALKQLQENKRILTIEGPPSKDNTIITFRAI